MKEYKGPFVVTVTDEDDEIVFIRKAEDVKIQHPSSLGLLDNEFDVGAWLKDPHGGPSKNSLGEPQLWMRIWVKPTNKEEDWQPETDTD